MSTPGKAALLALNVRSRCQCSACGWRVNRGLMKNKRRGRGQRRGRRSTLITGRGGLRFARADRQERQRTQLASLGSGSGVILLKTRSQSGCSPPSPPSQYGDADFSIQRMKMSRRWTAAPTGTTVQRGETRAGEALTRASMRALWPLTIQTQCFA